MTCLRFYFEPIVDYQKAVIIIDSNMVDTGYVFESYGTTVE